MSTTAFKKNISRLPEWQDPLQFEKLFLELP